MRRHTRTKAQALVEFALAATLIFTLLAAAVDIGLMFFTLQGLRNAAQEGAFYGSFLTDPVDEDGDGESDWVEPNYTEIRNRVRYATGERATGFANLIDLNNNETPDDAEGQAVLEEHIQVQSLLDVNNDERLSNLDDMNGDGEPEECTRTRLRSDARNCYIKVTVKTEYEFFFPLAPVFRDEITLQASAVMKFRSNIIF